MSHRLSKKEGITYIATLSGGKDSTAMCDLLLKNGYPVDYIVFNDTLQEHKLMYEYIEKLKQYFKDRYKKEIITTKPIRNFKDSILRKVTRSKTPERNGQYVGIPVANGKAMCHLRKTLKNNPTDKWIRKNIKNKHKIYIGFTTDEKERATKNDRNIYPLIDYFNMSDKDCKQYLIDQEMENPLYKFFDRSGCSICPYQSERDWWQIYTHFRDDFNLALEIEEKLSKQKEYKYFLNNKPLKDAIMSFKQGTLLDFSNEPLKDCFCKI